MIFSVAENPSGFTVCADGKPLHTPGKRPLDLPTKDLAEVVAGEWSVHKKFAAGKMPLTALAYTALDYIEKHEENIIETLLVYVDTDTLSYRASASEKLQKQQKEQWDPILAWAKKKYGVTWEVTSGIMPLEQPAALQDVIALRLGKMNAMQLSAGCMLASGFSSLALALSVLEKHTDAKEAYRLSRLEEESQAEEWGRDQEADARSSRMQAEMVAAGEFLRLLDGA